MQELEAYSLRDLQHFTHILGFFEAKGSDIPTIRAVLNEHMYGVARRRRDGVLKRNRKGRPNKDVRDHFIAPDKPPKCKEPDCVGYMKGYYRQEDDGTSIIIEKCEVCEFSKIVAIDNVRVDNVE